MSEEQLKAFLAKVKADASLQEQLKAEGTDVVAIAKAAGFAINTEDLAKHSSLSVDELEASAGGNVQPKTEPMPGYQCGWKGNSWKNA